MKSSKLFLCHSSKDKPFVRRLRNELAAFNHDIWLDEKEIKVGDSIFEAVQKGLLSSDYVLLVLSPNFLKSNWAQKELSSSFHLEMKLGVKKILPCVIKKVEIPLLISDRKYADFRRVFLNGLIEILDVITPVDDSTLDVYATNALVTLDIIKDDGSLVRYTKLSTQTSIIDNLTSYVDCLSVAGRITKLKVIGADVSRRWKESGFTFWELKYSPPLDKGNKLDIVTTADFLNSFTKAEEYWETLTNNHNADKFKVVVKFPISRPPKSWFLEERIGTKYSNRGDKGISFFFQDDRFHLALDIDNPVNHTTYFLRWFW
jgi:hypothetical protein